MVSSVRKKSNIVLSKEGFCSHNIEIGVKRGIWFGAGIYAKCFERY